MKVLKVKKNEVVKNDQMIKLIVLNAKNLKVLRQADLKHCGALIGSINQLIRGHNTLLELSDGYTAHNAEQVYRACGLLEIGIDKKIDFLNEIIDAAWKKAPKSKKGEKKAPKKKAKKK